MWTASGGKRFFAANDLTGCGDMSGLLLASLCPLAPMKSDGWDSHQK
jgi:hypothetical protein